MTVLIYANTHLDADTLKALESEYAKNDEELLLIHAGGVPVGFSNVVDISSRFDMNREAVSLRSEYVDTIADLNESFLKSNLFLKNEFSWFFLSDTSCKRTETNRSFSLLCEVRLLERIVKECVVSRVVMYGTNNVLARQIDGVELIEVSEREKENVVRLWFSLVKFVFFSFFSILYLKVFSRENHLRSKLKGRRAFLTRYPLHFTSEGVEEKYGDLVGDKDLYVVNLITDGMHQNLSPWRFIKALSKVNSQDNYYLLDRHLRLLSFFYCLWIPISHYARIKKHWEESITISGFDVSSVLLGEVHRSMFRYARFWPYLYSLPSFFSSSGIGEFIYYIHEFSFGRVFAYLLRSNSPCTSIIGMQHGPASMRKLLYFLSPKEVGGDSFSVKTIAMPDEVWAENIQSQKVYERAGYTNVKVLPKVPRLDYLNDITRKPEPGFVLVAPGLHDGVFVINHVNFLARNNSDKKYVVKLHPRSNCKLLSSLLELGDNISISDKHISALLPRAESVICTYSSVGLESNFLGIETEILTQPGYLNESPLLDATYEKVS